MQLKLCLFVAEVTYHTPSHAAELHTGEIPNPLEYWETIAKQFLVV